MNRVLSQQLGDTPVIDASVVLTTPSGQPTKQSGSSDWFTTLVQSAVPALANVYQAKELNKLNIARTSAGLAPITADQFSRTYQPPGATVSVGPSDSMMRMLLIGGLGLGAFFVAKALIRR